MAEMNDTPLVSIIIVTWNATNYIAEAIKSILNQEHKKIEIILVDNASTDNTINKVRKAFSKSEKITIIKNDTNLGFSAANNLGLKHTKGDYVLFLNPDARIAKSFFNEALKGFQDPMVGAVSGKILKFDGVTIDSAGQMLGKNRRPIERGYNTKDEGLFDRKGYCFSVCGAVALYKKSIIESISLNKEFFDEDFFSFYEDLDVGWRLNLLGWRCMYIPEAIAYHTRGGSSQKVNKFAYRYQIIGRPNKIQADIIRNRWFTIIKNDHLINLFINFPWIFVQELKTIIYQMFINPKLIPSIYLQTLKTLPKMLKKRKIIKTQRKLTASELRNKTE